MNGADWPDCIRRIQASSLLRSAKAAGIVRVASCPSGWQPTQERFLSGTSQSCCEPCAGMPFSPPIAFGPTFIALASPCCCARAEANVTTKMTAHAAAQFPVFIAASPLFLNEILHIPGGCGQALPFRATQATAKLATPEQGEFATWAYGGSRGGVWVAAGAGWHPSSRPATRPR